MAGEKYIVATADSHVQVSVRNMLNPCGYTFLTYCNDAASLMRMVRSYQPDFIIADLNLQCRDLRQAVEAIDDELLCTCILVGEYRDVAMSDLVEKSKSLTFSQKPLSREAFINTVELSLLYNRRLNSMNKKLKEMAENLEVRKLVEKAKWILIERDKISENEAYERMRRKSMDNRTSMKSIAQAIIFTNEIAGKGK